MAWLGALPERGRILVVNFTMGGGVAWHAELSSAAQPCLVLSVDRTEDPALVTLIPLVSLQPNDIDGRAHRMELRSFRDWPAPQLFGSLPRWARCGHLSTVSLDRCVDPSYKPPTGARMTSVVNATAADIAAIETCVMRGLGILGATRREASSNH